MIFRDFRFQKRFLCFLVDLNLVALVHLILGQTVHHRLQGTSAIKDKSGQSRRVLYNRGSLYFDIVGRGSWPPYTGSHPLS